MKYIAILTFIALVACAPAPIELPADFNPEFAF
jgi:hypothetical protein